MEESFCELGSFDNVFSSVDLLGEMLKKVKATVTEVLSDEPDTEQGLNYRKKN